jgi:hypothetical protein
MPNFGTMAKAATAGALLMYLYDPEQGVERRQKVRDKASQARDAIEDAAGRTARKVKDRAQDVYDRGKSRFSSDIENGTDWAPVARWLIGAGAAYLVFRGLSRRGALGYGLSTLGATALTRAVANRPVRDVLHLRRGDGERIAAGVESATNMVP